jgi:hypothetical protein
LINFAQHESNNKFLPSQIDDDVFVVAGSLVVIRNLFAFLQHHDVIVMMVMAYHIHIRRTALIG